MKIQCVWEHNGNDSLLYACNVPGAYARGESLEAALAKMPDEIAAFLMWKGEDVPEALEAQPDFLGNRVYSGSYGEEWSLAKVLRRFLWHDRIHAKAMYRMGCAAFGRRAVPDVFRFDR